MQKLIVKGDLNEAESIKVAKILEEARMRLENFDCEVKYDICGIGSNVSDDSPPEPPSINKVKNV